MTAGILVLGDQLSQQQAALAALEESLGPHEARQRCRVLLVESAASLHRMPLHRQRLVLLWSALRHFVSELRQAGWQVDHRETESFGLALAEWCGEHGITELHAMEPADRPVRAALERIIDRWGGPAPSLIWHPSNAFLWSREEFADWARGRRQLRMELFYREGRRRFGVLMEGKDPPPPPRRPMELRP